MTIQPKNGQPKNAPTPHDEEALKRDAERYRWLRTFAVPAFNSRSKRCVILLPRALGKKECLASEGLDAVVDLFSDAIEASGT